MASPLADQILFRLNINGAAYQVTTEVPGSSLDVLREHIRLTRTKKSCDQGACGACTVPVDGPRISLKP